MRNSPSCDSLHKPLWLFFVVHSTSFCVVFKSDPTVLDQIAGAKTPHLVRSGRTNASEVLVAEFKHNNADDSLPAGRKIDKQRGLAQGLERGRAVDVDALLVVRPRVVQTKGPGEGNYSQTLNEEEKRRIEVHLGLYDRGVEDSITGEIGRGW